MNSLKFYTEICKNVYESACTTRYERHDVTEDTVECETISEEKCEDVTQGYTTEQKCTKWPVQKCQSKAYLTWKYNLQTSCKKVPREVCGTGSVAVPQEEACFDRQQTVIQEVKLTFWFCSEIHLISYIKSNLLLNIIDAYKFTLGRYQRKPVTWNHKENANM